MSSVIHRNRLLVAEYDGSARVARNITEAGTAQSSQHPMRQLLCVLTALSCTAFAAGAQADSAANRPLITDVSIRGVKGVEINQLRDGLVTKASACKSPLYLPVCWITRSPIFTSRHYLDPLEVRRDARA